MLYTLTAQKLGVWRMVQRKIECRSKNVFSCKNDESWRS